jgi:rhamnosyltransferase
MSLARVSIVIPTRNGRATLPALLDGLTAQRAEGPLEIIAIDSGSTDGSVELLRHRADCLVQIDPARFDHGLTRNLGVERASADLVVLLVQDAEPASADWLAALTRPFADDPSIAGAYARQVARRDASGVTRLYLRHWQAASVTPRVSRLAGREEFMGLSPWDRYERCIFDNVCSCIRRTVWQRHPFRPTAMAEDLEWAREVLLEGHRIAYAPGAVVRHSHERGTREEYRRTLLVHQRLRELFDLVLVPDRSRLLRAVAASAVAHLRAEATPDVRRTIRALALAFAYPLGQYRGARLARPFVAPGAGAG